MPSSNVSLRLVVGLASVILSIPSAEGNTYQYSAGPRELGQGFSRINPNRAFPSCFDQSKLSSSPVTTTGRAPTAPSPNELTSSTASQNLVAAGPFSLQTRVVESRESLYSLMHIDMSLSARYLATSGSLSTSFDHQASFSSHDVTWVVFGEQQFAPITLYGDTESSLLPEVKNLLASSKKVRARCGDEYVKIQTRAAMIAAIFTLHSDSDVDMSDLKAHIEGGVSFTGGSVSMNGNFEQYISRAVEHGSIDIKIYGYGGGGITALPGALSATDLKTFQQVLATYISTQITPQQAVPISFTTGSFESFSGAYTSETSGSDDNISRIYLAYADLQPAISRIQSMVGGRSTRDYGYLTDTQVSELEALSSSLEDMSEKELVALRACIQKAACKHPMWDKAVDWPENPEPFCQKWKASVCQECDIEVRFRAENIGAVKRFRCHHMAKGAAVDVAFDGFITITDVETIDNKVWNSRVAISALELDKCDPCTADRSPPGPGQTNWFWRRLKLGGTEVISDGIAKFSLKLDDCRTGLPDYPRIESCDVAPPGTGSPFPGIQGGVRGFPPDEYPPAKAWVTFRVHQ